MTLKPSQIEDINMPGLSQSFPSLPVPDKEGVFHNDSPMKPDASRQALPAPVIRILAPTPEDEEHGSEPLAVRLATLALNSHHDEPAQDGSRSSRQPWTDELVKRPHSRTSYFIEDLDSDERDSEDDTSESDTSSGSEHEWSTELYNMPPPPRTPSPAETIRPIHSRCDCKASSRHSTSTGASECACEECNSSSVCLDNSPPQDGVQETDTSAAD